MKLWAEVPRGVDQIIYRGQRLLPLGLFRQDAVERTLHRLAAATSLTTAGVPDGHDRLAAEHDSGIPAQHRRVEGFAKLLRPNQAVVVAIPPELHEHSRHVVVAKVSVCVEDRCPLPQLVRHHLPVGQYNHRDQFAGEELE